MWRKFNAWFLLLVALPLIIYIGDFLLEGLIEEPFSWDSQGLGVLLIITLLGMVFQSIDIIRGKNYRYSELSELKQNTRILKKEIERAELEKKLKKLKSFSDEDV